MEVKFCPECGKPVQPALLSTKRQACASCGWTGDIIQENHISIEKQQKARMTIPKKRLQMDSIGDIVATGTILPIFGVFIGIFLLIIPIIGWILGIGVILMSGGAALVALRALGIKFGLVEPERSDYILVGECPYCDNDLTANLSWNKTKCEFCKERVLIKSEKFYTIIRKIHDEG